MQKGERGGGCEITDSGTGSGVRHLVRGPREVEDISLKLGIQLLNKCTILEHHRIPYFYLHHLNVEPSDQGTYGVDPGEQTHQIQFFYCQHAQPPLRVFGLVVGEWRKGLRKRVAKNGCSVKVFEFQVNSYLTRWELEAKLLFYRVSQS